MTTISGNGLQLDDSQFHALRVADVRRETTDTVSLVLDIPPALKAAFAYRAGQYVTVRADVGGQTLVRCYSMSSAPETDADLRITVRKVPGGAVSPWLVDDVKPGDIVPVIAPAGRFCLRDGERPLVLIGGGSGITPLLSLAKAALTGGRQVTLVYANRDRDNVIFADELDALGSDRFTPIHWIDAERGLIDGAGLAALGVLDAGADFYICGPDGLMDIAQAAALGAGADPDHVFLERFVSGPAAEPEDVATPDAAAGEGCQTLTFQWRGRTVEAAYVEGYPILAIARDAGLAIPFSCLAGACATCMGRLKSGTAIMEANSVLTPREVEQGYILTCQAIPTSRHVTVEFDD
ncbi:MAG: ferredoxin--NADP reductase [Sphingobium sp.]